MKICIVWDADYPWDVRIEKICQSLKASGNEVHLVCRNLKKKLVYEDYEGIHIHRLPKMTGGWAGMLGFPFFLNPIWLATIAKVISDHTLEIIIVRDLPMALAGVLIGKIKRVPCVLDMAEPYPEMLQGYYQLQQSSFKQKMVNATIRNSHIANIVEKFACRYLNHIFTVSTEISENLIKKGADPSKITVVHNTPRISDFFSTKSEKCSMDTVLKDKTLRVVYVGDLTEARGIPFLIHAFEKLVQNNQDFKLFIIGKGRYEHKIRAVVHEKNLEAWVKFLGFIPHERLPEQLGKCDIGIIPHVNTLHNNLTLPNKVFDYMALGLPIVTADLIPITRIIQETESGIVYEHDNADSLVRTIMKLRDDDLRHQLGQNGYKAVEKKYNWDNDYQTLISRLQGICNVRGI